MSDQNVTKPEVTTANTENATDPNSLEQSIHNESTVGQSATNDQPESPTATQETTPTHVETVINETQVTPDAGTGGNSQTQDVGQVSMASTADASGNTPLPDTDLAKVKSEAMADALNKELGNNVPSMVNPSQSVLTDSVPVIQSLPDAPVATAVGSALADAGVVTTEQAQAAASSSSDVGDIKPTEETNPTTQTEENSNETPEDKSTTQASTANSGSTPDHSQPMDDGSASSGTSPQSVFESATTDGSNSGAGSDDAIAIDSTDNHSLNNLSQSEELSTVEGDSHVQNNSNGITVSDSGGSRNETQSTTNTSDSSTQTGTDSSSSNPTNPATDSKESTAVSNIISDSSTSLSSQATDDSGSKGASSSGSQASDSSGTNGSSLILDSDNGGNAPGATPINQRIHADTNSSSTTSDDIDLNSNDNGNNTNNMNNQTPTTTAPSSSMNQTATATTATEVKSTPAQDAPTPVTPVSNTDISVPTPSNTQTTDTPGPAATLPSSTDSVSADNTTATSVEPPKPVPAAPTVINTGTNDSSTTMSTVTSNDTQASPVTQTSPPVVQTPAVETSTTEPVATSHGPTGIPEVDRVLEHLPATALGPILAIKNYMTMMAPRKSMDAKTGAQHQVSLFRAMTNIINREEEHFESLFTAMLRMFEHGKNDVFQESHVFRFQESLNLNADEQKGFQRLVNLFKVMGPVEDRALARKQVRVEESLTHGVTEEGRNRVVSYFDPNGR